MDKPKIIQPKPSEAPVKPGTVKIIMFTAIPLMTNNGISNQVTILTLGLGDNDIIYAYDNKIWRESA